MATDLYEILGVERAADEKAIKSAYRKLAMKWHPDKHKGDGDAEKKFKEINGAYEVLSDQQKRQQYDTFGSSGGPGAGGGFGGGGGGFDFSGFGGGGGGQGFADIFETFFGGQGGGGRGARKSRARRGNDIEANIRITFHEAVFGVEKELEIAKSDVCGNCKGDGAEKGSSIITCSTCRGSGEVRSVRNTILGQMATSHVCDMCEGEGKVPEKQCGKCHGTTRARVKDRVKVKIPAGVDNGSTIRLSGKGEGGVKGGPSGDLYINLMVEQSKQFVRHGQDVHSELEVHMLQALLGTEMSVDTLYGKETIKIPHGTQDGKVFKLSGRGVVKINSDHKGAHYVKVRVNIPDKLSKSEKEAYRKLAEDSGLDVSKGGLFG
ncbi:molecular chaperone DnaJ [Candidatus Gracilibacteria bacterium]|nr:molecular chaperone DnaJ [Candidatus Gracilibacteria bacterium]